MKKFLLLILLFSTHCLLAQGIVLNEIMALNQATIYDEDGKASDFIELYNNSSEQINLNGYYLSDDSLKIDKWQFENFVVAPGEHLIVFASDKDTTLTYFHTNFKISSSGETIYLSDSTGLIVDYVTIPLSLADISYARLNDGNSNWVFQTPSPGKNNTGIELEINNDEVVASHKGGFYPSSISVALSANNEIYYTLDGSDPNSSSQKYDGEISIRETSVLKALSIKNGLKSKITYHSYFISEESDLPVISLITDPDNLFDPDSGIYINYEEDWEKPARIEFFDDDKNLGFSENVGVNIYGGYTRRFDQKSLAIKFKSDYGKNKLDYELFPGFDITTFKSFILRNSGNDFDQTHIRDAFMQTLVKDLDIDYLEYRPALAFINGEFWGIYNIREKISEHYVANRHGVDPNNIDMMEGYSAYNDDRRDPDGEYESWVGNLNVIHGDTINYKQLIDYLNTEDLTTDVAYNFINSSIDIDECLLYYAAHVYYNSQDWPSNNSKYWRERSPEGKWRWILYDLDFGFNLYEWSNQGNSEDHVDYLFSGDPSQRPQSKPVESTFIPRKIVENPKIKNQFVNQVADLLNTNFKADRVLKIMNEIADNIADDIGRHRTRFNKNGDNLDRMISFAENRPGYLRDHVRDFFNSGNDSYVTVNSEGGGNIVVNSLNISSEDLPWSGFYYQDNTIYLNAIPESGYKFDGWSGNITSQNSSLEVSGIRTVNLTASFSIDTTTVKEVVINEINYNSANDFETGDWVELYNRTDDVIDISGWYFSDSEDDHKFILPSETILNLNDFLVLVENDSAFTDRFPDVKNYVSELGFGLSGSGELIRLFNENGQVIDSLTYDDQLPWPIEADGVGVTLELVDSELDNSVAENWKPSIDHGTPGKINSVLVAIKENKDKIKYNEYKLFQNYPNPFNPTTTIKYSIAKKSKVTLRVFDVLGKEVVTLFEGIKSIGNYTIQLTGNNLSSGVYYYRLETGEFSSTKKFILLK